MKHTICILSLLVWSQLCGADVTTGITFDGSMGHGMAPLPSTAVGGHLFEIQPSMGQSMGQNLFQSFGTFNVGAGDTASFLANAGTQNIIARVTGNSASQIYGTLKSPVNLFLLNSSGVMFGPNAQVDVTGAFTVGSPDYVKMVDGNITGKFNTHLGGDDMLTSANISAFGFMGNTPGAIGFDGGQPTFPNVTKFTVIGGDITLNQANVTVAAGNISLFSARGAGELAFDQDNPSVHFNTSTVASYGAVTMMNASKITLGTQGGGKVVIRGGVMVMEGASRIMAATSATSTLPGGSIDVHAGAFSLLENSNIATSTSGSAKAGNITVTADTLDIDGSASPTNSFFSKTGLVSSSTGTASGQAGDITAIVAGQLRVAGSGQIASDALSQNSVTPGNAGNVTVQAQTLSIDGGGLHNIFTGITSTTANHSAGTGGIVDISTMGNISIMGGGDISADTFSSGNAGEVDIHCLGSLLVDGSTSPNLPGISSASNTGATGNGGSVNLTVTDGIALQAGGQITAETHSTGNGGNVNVLHADSLTIDGTGAPIITAADSTTHPQLTGISSASVSTGATPVDTGNGGNINLQIDHGVLIRSEGQIVADTNSSHRGGDITLQADTLTIDGLDRAHGLTGITSSSGDIHAISNGQGGDVHITIASYLTCTGASGIEEETFSFGHAGVLEVIAGKGIALNDGGFISGDTFSGGAGGDVTVTAPTITIDGAGPMGAYSGSGSPTGIVSNANDFFSPNGTGRGGNVVVNASDSLTILNGGEVSALTQTFGNGGSVSVVAPGTVTLSGVGSQISSSSSNPATPTTFAGTAGDVTITAGTLQLTDHSNVSTSAVAADAGSISVTASDRVTLASGSGITTSAAADGGSIHLQVQNLVYLLDSSITATAGNLTRAGATGSGGNILIDPQFVVLDHGLISANAALGQGGNITIITNNFLNNQTLITATGATNGTISISSPDLDLSGSLIALPSNLIDNANRLREKCERAVNHEFSSFIVVGRGGTETAPDEFQADFGLNGLSSSN